MCARRLDDSTNEASARSAAAHSCPRMAERSCACSGARQQTITSTSTPRPLVPSACGCSRLESRRPSWMLIPAATRSPAPLSAHSRSYRPPRKSTPCPCTASCSTRPEENSTLLSTSLVSSWTSVLTGAPIARANVRHSSSASSAASACALEGDIPRAPTSVRSLCSSSGRHVCHTYLCSSRAQLSEQSSRCTSRADTGAQSLTLLAAALASVAMSWLRFAGSEGAPHMSSSGSSTDGWLS
mmetsp:Transcript_7753/g.19126  ORF Transcript_7753/g.19126 Transcript_7753/m.19126 type:complete len:241 (-) Transcript_7753:105-827(-)